MDTETVTHRLGAKDAFKQWMAGIISDAALNLVIRDLGITCDALAALNENGAVLRYVQQELRTAIDMRARRKRN